MAQYFQSISEHYVVNINILT